MQISTLTLAFTGALVLAGCSSTSGEGSFKPGYDPGMVSRIAIVDGNNPTFKQTTRQSVVDAFQMEFFKRGWPIVERSNIQKAIDELDFQGSEFASDDERRSIGQVLNVGALVVVNIAAAGDEFAVTAKMFDVETGEVLWMGDGEGAVRSGFSTFTGALAGAAIGAAAGDSDTAVLGGLAGGAVGYGLSPSEMENAKKVVKAICESIPSRI